MADTDNQVTVPEEEPLTLPQSRTFPASVATGDATEVRDWLNEVRTSVVTPHPLSVRVEQANDSPEIVVTVEEAEPVEDVEWGPDAVDE